MTDRKGRNLQPLLLAAIMTMLAATPALAQVKKPDLTDEIEPTRKLPVEIDPTEDWKIDPEVLKIDPEVLERSACPDPAAVELEANLVARSSTWPDFQGTVDIVGVVRNVGRGNYASGRGQQGVQLLEQWPGSSPRVVRTANFTNLNAGADVRVTYRKNWAVTTEFPPRYMLNISYGPDIFIDGNEANDDCRLDNNMTSIEPRQINVVFD